MKNFIYKIFRFLILLLVVCLATGVFCVKIDPYNVFHPLDIVDNGIEPNKNFIKMTYIINNPNKFDSYIFGSSRVGNIHGDKIWNEKVYNMTYSNATPKEILSNIKTLLKHDILPKHIYLGLDSLSYTIEPNDHMNELISIPYEQFENNPASFYLKYLDPAMVLNAFFSVIKNHNFDEYYKYRFYEYGWNVDYANGTTQEITYDFNNAGPSLGNYYRLDETLEEIQNIVDLCKQNKIELTVFVNPMYYVTYEASLSVNYYDFLIGLANITEYYNFSGYNEITIDSANWIDNSHFSAEVSDMMKEVFCYNQYYSLLYDEGFGVKVTKDNISNLISILEECRNNYLENGVPYRTGWE